MVVVFVVFVDQFRKPLILLTFLDFGLVDRLWFLRVVLWFCGSLVVFWNARSALRVRNGKSHAKWHKSRGNACPVRVAHCV